MYKKNGSLVNKVRKKWGLKNKGPINFILERLFSLYQNSAEQVLEREQVREEYGGSWTSLKRGWNELKSSGLVETRGSAEGDFLYPTQELVREFENMREILDPHQFKDEIMMIQNYLRNFHLKEVSNGENLTIDWNHLYKHDMSMGEALIESPLRTLHVWARSHNGLRGHPDHGEDPLVDGKRAEVPGVYNLPVDRQVNIGDIRDTHLFRLFSVRGVVRKAAPPRTLITLAAFECLRCGGISYVEQTYGGAKLSSPHVCESCEKAKPSTKLLLEHSQTVSYRRLVLQEDFQQAKEEPQNLTIDLYGGLSREDIRPGDQVKITGVYRDDPLVTPDKKVVKTALWGIHMEKLKPSHWDMEIGREDEEEILKFSKREDIYDALVSSIAPHVYGHRDIKEAIAYQLFSSPAVELLDGGRVRGDIHILLLGDPATAKSSLLRQVVGTLSPRGVTVSGKGATAAGLSATAIKDESVSGESAWTLEAGALVLADRGMAGVDELEKMRQHDRAAIHDALESQFIPVNKAGINTTLNSRCSVLAAANPKYGRFDDYKALSEQVALDPAILSRFDLTFFVRDDPSKTREVTRHILKSASRPEEVTPPVEPEFLKKYVAYARQKVAPVLDEGAEKTIEDFYVDTREKVSETEDSPMPMTARQLWAAIRLARARARARLSEVATKEDAEAAVRLIRESLRQAGMDLETGEVDIDRLYSDTPKSQRDRYKAILQIIATLEDESPNGQAEKEEIIKEAGKKSMNTAEVEEALNRLKKENDIYEPKFEHYKTL